VSVLNWSRVGEMATQEVKVKALLYGDSGAGKTHTASTAPRPCYLLTEANGLPTIRAANPDAVVVQANDMDTVRAFFKAAMDGTLAKETGCQTIVLDSLTELQRMLRDEIVASRKGQVGGEAFSLQDWGTLTDRMRKLVRTVRDLPFHVVCIALAASETDEASGQRYTQPAFDGRKLPNEIAGYFSLVGYVYRERSKAEDGTVSVQHRVLLQGPPTLLTKGLPGLDPVEPPNVTAWLAKLSGEQAPQPAQAAQAAPVRTEAPDPTQPARRRRGAQ
jgi:hypothetical protein